MTEEAGTTFLGQVGAASFVHERNVATSREAAKAPRLARWAWVGAPRNGPGFYCSSSRVAGTREEGRVYAEAILGARRT